MPAWWFLSAALAAERVDLGVEAHIYHPVWSPDGKALVVEANRHAEDASLRVVTLADRRVRAVTLEGVANPFATEPPVAMNPVWRTSSSLICEGTDAAGRYRLWSVDAGGSVAQLPVTPTGDLTFPSLDAAGDLGFVADDTGFGDLWIRRGGAADVQLTRTPAPEMFPALSAGGDRVAYSRKVGASEDLFVLDRATGTERALAGGAGDQTRPAWVGGAVAYFDGSRGAGAWDLALVDAAGAKRVLARDVSLPLRARPAVRADGRWLAYVPDSGGKLVLVTADGSARAEVRVDQVAVAEVAVGTRIMDGVPRTWVAWTGLPASGSGWRSLWIEDVTETLRSTCTTCR